MKRSSFLALLCLALVSAKSLADDPKQTKENTISVSLATPVKPQNFPRPVKFAVGGVVDRTGDPQPMLVLKARGGVFVDRQPHEIVKQALEESLKAADLLAADSASADFLLTVYLFHFGLAAGTGMEFYGKVDLNVVVKHVPSGASKEVTALGTCIERTAITKKNIMKNVKANMEKALEDGLRNFLRGNKLREVIESVPGAAPATSSDYPALPF